MLNTDEKLQEKIESFLRRKEAQYPELAQQSKYERTDKDSYKPTRISHWALSARSN